MALGLAEPPFYAVGVFTGFAMAGFGMARYHHRTREPGWRRKLAIPSGDFRDWDAITEWAGGIAADLADLAPR
jgi:hypothetical protein